ncbi:MAG: SVM family protein [Candidatus Phytoplasma stylosanthis]|nr:SVM family protein [Candidatus Phytoplasma stylosanthis]
MLNIILFSGLGLLFINNNSVMEAKNNNLEEKEINFSKK